MTDLPQEDEMEDQNGGSATSRRRFLAVLGGAAGAALVLAKGVGATLANIAGQCKCPLCGSETAERVVHWSDGCPSPNQLIAAWEAIGSPGHVTVSQDLMASTGQHEWSDPVPKHPLFGTSPKEAGWINADVESGAGFWIRAGASHAERQKKELAQQKALTELTRRGD